MLSDVRWRKGVKREARLTMPGVAQWGVHAGRGK